MKSILSLFFAVFCTVIAPFSQAQTQVAPFLNSRIQLFNVGAPCSGCLLDTFAAGTTTPLATYSESTGTTPNANPVVLASDGSATVYMTNASYKLRLRTAAGATIWTQDQVTWNNLATTLSSLTLTGNATINSSTAATNVANQSGPTFCMNGNFWNGSASAVDSWCWNDVLGTGTNPTSTLTLVHSGSSGTPVFSVPALSASSATIGGPLVAKIDEGVQMANIYATGGDGSQGNPWTSASGTGGIQEAINIAALTGGKVHMPAGYYKITVTVNLTANSASGFGISSAVNPLILDGDGKGKTFLVGFTGAAVIDGTGRGALVLKNFTITQGSSNKSTVGIYLARATATQSNFSQFNVIENVYCELPTIPTANSNHGTACGYDFAAEGNRWINNEFNGDNPLVLSGDNTFGITSAYQTVLTSIPDMTQSIISGGQYTAEGVTTGQGILLQGIVDNTRIENVTTEYLGATVIPAIRITPQVSAPSTPVRNITIENLQAESPAGQAAQAVVTSSILQGSNFTGNVSTAAGGPPIIKLVGATGQLLDSTVNIVPGNAGVTTPLIGDSGVASAGLFGGLTFLNAGESISLASSTCSQIYVLAHFSSPTVTCNGALTGFTGADTWNSQVAGNYTLNSGGNFVFSASGTGSFLTNGALNIGTSGSNTLSFFTNNTGKWAINSTGALFPLTDNSLDIGGSVNRPRDLYFSRNLLTPNVLISETAPTIAAGGCGGAAASIATTNGTAAFTINVGTTPTSAGCVVTLPTATNGWNCFVTDITTNSTSVFLQKQTATGSSATAATLVNYSDVAVATAPTASDIWQVSCHGR